VCVCVKILRVMFPSYCGM